MLWCDSGLRSNGAEYPPSNTCTTSIAMSMARYATGLRSISWNSVSTKDIASGFLVPETVIIFDEYSVATHEFRAFADYRSAFWRSAHPVAMTSDYAAQVAFV